MLTQDEVRWKRNFSGSGFDEVLSFKGQSSPSPVQWRETFPRIFLHLICQPSPLCSRHVAFETSIRYCSATIQGPRRFIKISCTILCVLSSDSRSVRELIDRSDIAFATAANPTL